MFKITYDSNTLRVKMDYMDATITTGVLRSVISAEDNSIIRGFNESEASIPEAFTRIEIECNHSYLNILSLMELLVSEKLILNAPKTYDVIVRADNSMLLLYSTKLATARNIIPYIALNLYATNCKLYYYPLPYGVVRIDAVTSDCDISLLGQIPTSIYDKYLDKIEVKPHRDLAFSDLNEKVGCLYGAIDYTIEEINWDIINSRLNFLYKADSCTYELTIPCITDNHINTQQLYDYKSSMHISDDFSYKADYKFKSHPTALNYIEIKTTIEETEYAVSLVFHVSSFDEYLKIKDSLNYIIKHICSATFMYGLANMVGVEEESLYYLDLTVEDICACIYTMKNTHIFKDSKCFNFLLNRDLTFLTSLEIDFKDVPSFDEYGIELSDLFTLHGLCELYAGERFAEVVDYDKRTGDLLTYHQKVNADTSHFEHVLIRNLRATDLFLTKVRPQYPIKYNCNCVLDNCSIDTIRVHNDDIQLLQLLSSSNTTVIIEEFKYNSDIPFSIYDYNELEIIHHGVDSYTQVLDTNNGICCVLTYEHDSYVLDLEADTDTINLTGNMISGCFSDYLLCFPESIVHMFD